jgi:hypothetical protein
MRTNYTEWSLVMKVNLQVAGLWDVIDSHAGEYHEDRSRHPSLSCACGDASRVGCQGHRPRRLGSDQTGQAGRRLGQGS